MTYIEQVPNIDNAFGLYGTLCHTVLEKWATGELLEFELEQEYENLYDKEMKLPFPPFPKGMAEKYYTAGKEYFTSFEGFGEEWEILSAEEKFVLDIGGNQFSGIADLILKHKETGKIMVVDHKSKSMNSMKKQLETYKKQLYIYALYCKERFGEYPTTLRFNMFKDGVYIDEEFDPVKLEEVKQWVIDTIEKIKAETEWRVHPSDYFCKFICGVAPHCPAAVSMPK